MMSGLEKYFACFILLGFQLTLRVFAQLNDSQYPIDPALERKIQALDEYINLQMISKQMNGSVTPPGNDVPDMSVLSQLFVVAGEKLQSAAICAGCNVGIGLLILKVRVAMLNASDIIPFVTFSCNLFVIASPEVCSGIVERYGPTFAYLLQKIPQLGPTEFCGVMLQSYGCKTRAKWLEWDVDIPPAAIRLTNEKYPKKDSRHYSTRSADLVKIIQLTDIHVDPLYEPGSNAECRNKYLCCRSVDEKPTLQLHKAGYFADSRSCDVPYEILERSLMHISKQHPDAKFLYLTGDIVPHNIWSTSQSENTEVILHSAKLVLKHLPSIHVIPLLGNHEPHPVNSYSPKGVPDELSTNWIYEVGYDAFKTWIPADQADLFKNFGYFAVNVTDKFRLLVLNTNICYEFNVWQMYNPGDYGGQLKWLIDQLLDSEVNNGTVHILGHVPPGYAECFRVFSKNFYNIILRFYRVVKGQFYGHTHFDEFKVYLNSNFESFSTLWISPSLTAYELNNVAYRVFYADPENFEILNQETWVFDLKSANQAYNLDPAGVPGNSVQWFPEYNGTTAYDLPDLTPTSMGYLVEKMAKDPQVFARYYQYYNKILDGHARVSCNTHCRKRVLCAIVRSYVGETENCDRVQKMVDGIVLPISVLEQKIKDEEYTELRITYAHNYNISI